MTPETTRSGGNASIASRSDVIHTFRQRLAATSVLESLARDSTSDGSWPGPGLGGSPEGSAENFSMSRDCPEGTGLSATSTSSRRQGVSTWHTYVPEIYCHEDSAGKSTSINGCRVRATSPAPVSPRRRTETACDLETVETPAAHRVRPVPSAPRGSRRRPAFRCR